MKPLEQVVEHAVVAIRRPSGESAAQRRGNSGLVGQVFDADDAPVHMVPGCRLLLSVASH